MDALQVFLFGSFRVFHHKLLIDVKLTRATQALLAYLLLQRHRTHPRDVLADLFWSESSQERARGSLNTVLWRLRSVLEPRGIPHGTYLITTQHGEVGFNRESNYWLDVAEFEEEIKKVLVKPLDIVRTMDLNKLESTLELYRGDLLLGFYDDWALRERERMRFYYLEGLAYLMRAYKISRTYDKSLACAQRILALDGLREEIHREVIGLHLETGQRALAVKQYEICRETLALELGIPPMEETETLYQQMISGPNRTGRKIGPEDLMILQQSVQEIRQAVQNLESSLAQIQRTILSFENSGR